jgi:hypothetical protein
MSSLRQPSLATRPLPSYLPVDWFHHVGLRRVDDRRVVQYSSTHSRFWVGAGIVVQYGWVAREPTPTIRLEQRPRDSRQLRSLSVVSMLKAILVTTATLAARTPAAPLMPQNQGMGPALIVETNHMPVGNAKPIRKPAGANTRTQRPARTTRSAPSRPNTIGDQNGNAVSLGAQTSFTSWTRLTRQSACGATFPRSICASRLEAPMCANDAPFHSARVPVVTVHSVKSGRFLFFISCLEPRRVIGSALWCISSRLKAERCPQRSC